MKKNEINVISGQASFVDGSTVAVIGNVNYIVKAKDIIVATGSKISKIPIPGIDLPFVLNSTTALSCTDLPKSIAIIGGGVIGMEFAFIYKNFGVEVHVIEFMDRLLAMVDSDISREIQDIAVGENIKVHTSSKVMKIQNSVDGKAVITYEDKDGEHLLVSDKVLVAIGREPNIEGLAIEKSGVLLNNKGRGIQVDASMRTNIKHIYAIGDVTNVIQLAHVASHQGIVAVDNILNKQKEMDYSAVPNVIFTAPEIASVCIGEDAAKANGINIAVSKFSFAGNGKALTMNEPRGFIKLVKSNETGKIIGGSIIGADASSLISALTLAIANGLTDKEITETIFPHPTTGEVIHEAALDFGIGALHQ
jgi:dihydrolipoamide dehydrogenase